MDQTACKPGSVPPGPKPRHWRSFLWTAPRGTVLATYPDRSGLRQPCPHLPKDKCERTVPIRSCSWRGLPCRPCCQARVGLLPHPFTLTPDESEAVCSLWRYPWGHPRRALPAAMSSWSPDFPRPPCGSRDRPAVWSARKVVARAGRVNLEPLGEGEVVLDRAVLQAHPAREAAL